MSPYSVVRGMTQARKQQRGCCAAASTGQKAASFRPLQGNWYVLAPHFRPCYAPRSTSRDQLSPRLILSYTMLDCATSFRDGMHGIETLPHLLDPAVYKQSSCLWSMTGRM